MNKREFMKALDAMMPDVAEAFIVSVEKSAAAVSFRDLEAAIRANDAARVIDLLGYKRGDFSEYERAIVRAIEAGGDGAAGYYAGLARAQGVAGVKFAFDAMAPEVVDWMRDNSSTLIVEITEDQRQAVRDILTLRTEEGRGVRSTARDLVGRLNLKTGRREGGLVGLTSQEAEYANNAYAELVSGEPEQLKKYLNRKARDKRFDGTVKKAIKEGRQVPVGQAARMTQFYRGKLLKVRGERIARTETIAAMNEGREQMRSQLLESGEVEAEDIVLKWDASDDADTRDSHKAMDGDESTPGKPFTSGLGNRLMYPGDRSHGAPAEDTINCRCFVQEKVDFIGAAKRRGEI
jgi:hypothetical protein